jgi:hypothetical protein
VIVSTGRKPPVACALPSVRETAIRWPRFSF